MRVLCIFALKMAQGPNSMCVCTFKSPPFQCKQTIHPRVQTCTDRAVRWRWAIHQSSFIRESAMTDIHHPTLNLPDPNLPPQSEQPEFPRIAAPTSTSAAQITSVAALTFANFWSYNLTCGSSVDECCSGGLLISFLLWNQQWVASILGNLSQLYDNEQTKYEIEWKPSFIFLLWIKLTFTHGCAKMRKRERYSKFCH